MAGVLRLVLLLIGCTRGLYDPVHHIESARLYGNMDAYAYWFVDLLVGNPPQRTSTIVDTGSGLTAFTCAGCTHCGNHIDPQFDVSKSSTFSWQSCGGGCRGGCLQKRCSYSMSYLEGSSISGFRFMDDVSLGDRFQLNPPIKASMGCHQSENKLFYTQKANGIFGIQGHGTLLEHFMQSDAVGRKVFALCLAEWGGLMTVGGMNESLHRKKVQWVRMGHRYGVPLQYMRVDGQSIFGFRGAIVDSGTTFTYTSRQAYKALRQRIENACSSNKCGASRSDQCWTVPSGNLDKFPTVEVQFNGARVSWVPSSYLYRKAGRWCYAFQDDGPNAITTLGASFIMNMDVVFDLGGNRIGWAEASCPVFKGRPHHQLGLKRGEQPKAAPIPQPKAPPPRPAPTNSPTRAPTPSPTKAPPPRPVPTNSPTRAPTPSPTKAEVKLGPPAATSSQPVVVPKLEERHEPGERSEASAVLDQARIAKADDAVEDLRQGTPLLVTLALMACMLVGVAGACIGVARRCKRDTHVTLAEDEEEVVSIGNAPNIVGSSFRDDDGKAFSDVSDCEEQGTVHPKPPPKPARWMSNVLSTPQTGSAGRPKSSSPESPAK